MDGLDVPYYPLLSQERQAEIQAIVQELAEARREELREQSWDAMVERHARRVHAYHGGLTNGR